MKDNKFYKVISATLAAFLIVSSFKGASAGAVSSLELKKEIEEILAQTKAIENSISLVKTSVSEKSEKVNDLNDIINNYKNIIEDANSKGLTVTDELDQVKEEKDTVAEQIAKLNKLIKDKIDRIFKLEEETKQIKTRVDKTEQAIIQTQEEVDNNTKLLQARLIVMYKQGPVKAMEVLFTSKDITDFLGRQTMVETITKHDKELIEKLQDSKDRLDELKGELNGQKIALEVATTNAKAEKISLEEDKKAQDKLFNELMVEEGLKQEEIEYLKSVSQEYEGYLNSTLNNKEELSKEIQLREDEITDLEGSLKESLKELESTKEAFEEAKAAEEKARLEEEKRLREEELRKERERIAQEQERIRLEQEKIKKEQERLEQKKQELDKLKQVEKNQIEEEKKAAQSRIDSLDVASNGDFSWPAATSNITSYFGWRYIFGAPDFHLGIDIAGPVGTSIYASKSGVVSYAGWLGGYGKLVEINHGNGYKTRYAHLSSISVGVGEKVGAGQNIARMGTTGRSTGPHLHFEVLLNGSQRNPMNYLR